MIKGIKRYWGDMVVLDEYDNGFIAHLSPRKALEYTVVNRHIDEDIADFIEKTIDCHFFGRQPHYFIYLAKWGYGIKAFDPKYVWEEFKVLKRELP